MEDAREFAEEQGDSVREALQKENPASSPRRAASFTRRREADILTALKGSRV
jgi:hypothetical protein